ncbi:MAG: hypothetical protein M3P96_03875 [Actinomycetota bacterium]|nr:hypothetical protein [Actinomycetota bacterium]
MRRLLCCLLACIGLSAAGPPAAATPVAGERPEPVVLLHGWAGSGARWDPLVRALLGAGVPVLDFDEGRPGIQPLTYAPTRPGQHLPYVAAHIVQPAILAALARAGYPADQRVDVVGHSMGGLVARFLVEQSGADVDSWEPGVGWHGDGVPDVAPDWAARVDDLVMLGTPNSGTWEGWVPTTKSRFLPWGAAGGDLRPGSPLLRRMGRREPAGEHYVAIGGEPVHGQYLRSDHDGDGVARGFDGVVPAESPYVVGAELAVVRAGHSLLSSSPATLELVLDALDVGPAATRPRQEEEIPVLRGNAVVRLEGSAIVADHDLGTRDENRFEVWLDPDGGGDSYRLLSTVEYDADAPFRRDWGDTGPVTAALALPGTAPTVDVRVVAYELDTRGRRDPVAVFTFRHLSQSEDRDGQDFYEARASDTRGGTDVLRIALLGVGAG